MYDKEKIYDEKISPLMSEIIKICKENDIQVLFSCYLKTDDKGDMSCNTYLESKEENCDKLKNAAKCIALGYIAHKPYFTAMTITSTKEAANV